MGEEGWALLTCTKVGEVAMGGKFAAMPHRHGMSWAPGLGHGAGQGKANTTLSACVVVGEGDSSFLLRLLQNWIPPFLLPQTGRALILESWNNPQIPIIHHNQFSFSSEWNLNGMECQLILNGILNGMEWNYYGMEWNILLLLFY